MKTCADCIHFEKDEQRSKKLEEPIGLCRLEHGWTIGYNDAYENCDGFDGFAEGDEFYDSV